MYMFKGTIIMSMVTMNFFLMYFQTQMVFIDAFLQNNRLDHLTQLMGYHPTYLEFPENTAIFIERRWPIAFSLQTLHSNHGKTPYNPYVMYSSGS